MCYWLYNRPMDVDAAVARREVRKKPRARRGQQARAEGGLRLRRRDRGLPGHLRGPAREARARHLPQHHAATPRWRSASSPRRRRRGLPLFLGSYPITPASDILHELSMYKDFGVITFQAEDEIAAIALGDRRGLRRRARLTTTSRPGHGAEDRGHRPGDRWSSCRSSSSTSSAAGRRPACRPRPSRPTCCRRCSAATARRRCRSSRPRTPGDCFYVALEAVPHRAQVHDAGDPALRRLPRQRRRALADPDAGRPARRSR